MGEYLPDGSYQHYTGPCPDCGEYVNVNIQGNIIDHKCSQSNKSLKSDTNKQCQCEHPLHQLGFGFCGKCWETIRAV